MIKTIAVLGITGNQGGAVAEHFLQDPNWSVRGITRNTTSESARALSARGIELVQADLDNPSSWDKVFSGCHAIFAMTDFWQPFFSVYPKMNEDAKDNRAAGKYAAEVEIRRAKTIVDAAAKVLEDEGLLEIFVYSSLPGFKELSKGKFDFAYHFDAKKEVNVYIEENQKKLWEKTSILNMGFYYTNMRSYPLMYAPQKQQDNTYLFATTGSPNSEHPFVYPPDTGKFVSLLVHAKPGKNLLGVSETLTNLELMKIWSEVTGLPCQVAEVSVEQVDAQFPGGVARESAESMASSAEFGWGNDLVLPTDIDPNVKLTSWKEYVAKENWDFVKGT